MDRYDRALGEIADIRAQMAAGTVFRGFGPPTLLATGCFAVAVAAIQSASVGSSAAPDVAYFAVWIATAVLCVGLIGLEMVCRSRRHHGPLADAMILNAVRQFLPCGAAGAAVAVVVALHAPGSAWLLPGLWQLFVAIGLFAAAPSLPAGTPLAAAWYFLAGCAVLILAAADGLVSPWFMGVPFAVGQTALAVIVFRAGRAAS